MKRIIPEIQVKSFLPVYYHHLTETIAIKDTEGNEVCVVPREYIEEHVVVFGESLLRHLTHPTWKIRGYQSAVGFEIGFCGNAEKQVLSVCKQFLEHPEYFLDEKQLDDWEIVVFGPDHKIGANIFDFIKYGKKALDEQGRLHGGYKTIEDLLGTATKDSLTNVEGDNAKAVAP